MTFSARVIGSAFLLFSLSIATTLLGLSHVTLAEDAVPANLVGRYDCNGVGVNGAAYQGEVRISKRGQGYRFDWQIGGEQYNGIGFAEEGRVNVSWILVVDGKVAHGVVSYKINENGTLEGKWIDHNAAVVFTEMLTPQGVDRTI